jgi:UDP-2,4-diacetamido-2,4,6-trideoxy-beta-L-altropyranose hydrolase
MQERNWQTCLYGSTETNRLAEKVEGFSSRKDIDGAAGNRGAVEFLRHDLLVVDHYELDAAFETRARRQVGAILVISDWPDRSHVCEVLLDQNLGRSDSDYRAVTPPTCAILTGPDYALLRPRYRKFSRPPAPGLREPARNLLVTFGGSDPKDATGTILQMLKSIASPRWRIRVVLGPSYRHNSTITDLARDWPALEVERAPNDLLASMQWADAAITAAGGTMWELCFSGVPFAALNTGTIPNSNAQRLHEREASIDLGTLATLKRENLVAALQMIMDDSGKRRTLADNAFHLVDGRGAERVCASIEKHLCAA